MKTDPEWDYWTLTAMGVYGGGFVQALRRLYSHADEDNQRRIRETWPEIGVQFREMGKKLKKDGGGGSCE